VGTRPGGQRPPYTIACAGYAFELPAAEVARLKELPDFELKEEPAVADEFLRFRAERWAENLADAGAPPGPVEVRIDPRQRKTLFYRGPRLLFGADI
jgi:hypothetical protein